MCRLSRDGIIKRNLDLWDKIYSYSTPHLDIIHSVRAFDVEEQWTHVTTVKGKAVPLQAWTDP
jgi:hypothetical protein